jgi:hypothetical protein
MSENNGKYRNSVFVYTLGVKNEVIPYDFTNMGWDAEEMMKRLHYYALNILMDKQLPFIYCWSVRATNMFLKNNIHTVGQVICLSPKKVNGLVGCGLAIKKEVYYTFSDEFNIKLDSWSPYEDMKRYGL